MVMDFLRALEMKNFLIALQYVLGAMISFWTVFIMLSN